MCTSGLISASSDVTDRNAPFKLSLVSLLSIELALIVQSRFLTLRYNRTIIKIIILVVVETRSARGLMDKASDF